MATAPYAFEQAPPARVTTRFGWLRALLRWMPTRVPAVSYADQSIARQAYADYLRAQIIGFSPTDGDALLKALTTAEVGGERLNTASFGTLMGVETKLVGLLSDDLVERTYWIVRERFNRIVGAGGQDALKEYQRWSPESLVEPADQIPLRPVLSGADSPPEIDAVSLDRDALDREATQRHAEALDIAAQDTAQDTGQDTGQVPGEAETDPASDPALDQNEADEAASTVAGKTDDESATPPEAVEDAVPGAADVPEDASASPTAPAAPPIAPVGDS